MAYEHKVIVVLRSEHTTNKGTIIYGENIAEYKCSRMPHCFYNIFKQNGIPIDFDLYDGNDEPTKTDPYGEHCKMLPLQDVIDCLRDINANDADYKGYRRIAPLIGLLEGFNEAKWTEHYDNYNGRLYAVNYGY